MENISPEFYSANYSKVEVNILSVYGPHKIGVRLEEMKEKYFQFEKRLNWICNNSEMKALSGATELHDFYYLEDEEVCLVRITTNWYRAQIIFVYKFTVGVRLVDIGKEMIIEDPMSLRRVVHFFASGERGEQELFRIPDKYKKEILEPHAFSFWVHLSQIPIPKKMSLEIRPEVVDGILRNQSQVHLIQRAPPLEIQFPDWALDEEDYQEYMKASDNIGVEHKFISMPAEICWTELHSGDKNDPFSPAKPRNVTLSQCLYRDGHVKFDDDDIGLGDLEIPDYVEDDVPEDDVLDDAEFKNLRLCIDHEDDEANENVDTKEDTRNVEEEKFRWLDPELPVDREFLARGTFVDRAGQIYMHLYSGRKQFRMVRQLLTDRLGASDPDDEVFEEHEDVIAYYVDDQKWHRGRFIEYYTGSNQTQCLIFFVDWGSVSKVNTSLVRKNVLCKEVPILAFKAVLHNVLPAQGREWSDEALDFIQEKIFYGNPVMEGRMGNVIKVKTISRLNKQPLLVEILIPTREGEYFSLSQLLLDHNEAKEASLSEVDSMEQRKLRKELDFGVRFKKLSKAERRNQEGQLNKHHSTSAEVFREIPELDLRFLESATLVHCQIVSVLSWNRLVVHLDNQSHDHINYDLVEKTMMMSCPSQNPVTLVRTGMYLGYLHELMDWVRVEILEHDSRKDSFLIRLLDFGTEEWVHDDGQFRQLPEQVAEVPVQAVELQLPLAAVTTDDSTDDDTLQALVSECILNADSNNNQLLLRVRCVSETAVFGHLLDSSLTPIYKSLEKEKVVKLL